jgi:hypothetical protein
MSPPDSPIGEQRIAKLPSIAADDSFVKIVKALSVYADSNYNSYFVDEITMPSTFEQLRTTSAGNKIRILVDYLVSNVTNPALINAMLSVNPEL